MEGTTGTTVLSVRVAIAIRHRLFREALSRTVAREPGFEVVAQADDGYELLDLLERREADILLLGMALPGLHGLLVMQVMAQKGMDIPTVILASSASRQEVVEAMRLGARGIMYKDTSVDSLLAGLRRVAAGEYLLDRGEAGAVIKGLLAPPAAKPPAPSTNLTQRELEVVRGVARGASNKEIARTLQVKEQTVKNNLSGIYQKLGVANRLELVLYAINHHLCDEPVRPCPIEHRPGSCPAHAKPHVPSVLHGTAVAV